MQLYFVDRDPCAAAEFLMDQHVTRMTVENLRLLSTAWHNTSPSFIEWREVDTAESLLLRQKIGRPFLNGFRIYTPAYGREKLVEWIAADQEHYLWLWCHTAKLVLERLRRFGTSPASIAPTLAALAHSPEIPHTEWKDPPLLAEDDDLLEMDDAVEAHREYYRRHKVELGRWTNRQPPEWLGPEAMKNLTSRQAVRIKDHK